ncbi:MAG: BlaI/MecI/CopY family transcriptional regulator [Cyanobacteria bacterium REEB65]|nr:BlaI/MecI/CopY family transcriptional regulator [Cyanobacteria bacterium REEB65]
MPEPDLSVFRPGKPGLRKVLGDLEADIMDAVWNRGPGAQLTVRDVVNELQPSRGSAYTTVMTVMGILTKKGLLKAEKAGNAHIYEATLEREAFTASVVGKILNDLMSDFAAPVLAHLAQAAGAANALQGWAERIQIQREQEK